MWSSHDFLSDGDTTSSRENLHWPGKFFRASYKLVYIIFRVSGKEKKKLTPLALEGFEKIDFNFLKKIIYKWKNNFYVFGNLIVPSDRKSREDHESPHFCGSTTLSFWVMAILRYLFFNFFEFLKKNFSNFLANFFFKMFVFGQGIQWAKKLWTKIG